MAHKSKATPWEDRSGRRCLAASSLLQGRPSCSLPAQLHIAPSLSVEGRGQGLGPLSGGTCTPSVPGTSNQPVASSRGCFGAAGAARKAVCCLFQHGTPAGRTRQLSPHLLVVFGLQLGQQESLHAVVKVILERKMTPCIWERRFTQGGTAQPVESGTRWAPIHVYIFHTHTQSHAHTHIHAHI